MIAYALVHLEVALPCRHANELYEDHGSEKPNISIEALRVSDDAAGSDSSVPVLRALAGTIALIAGLWACVLEELSVVPCIRDGQLKEQVVAIVLGALQLWLLCLTVSTL